jgi:phage-related protein (TIGR01555 family)
MKKKPKTIRQRAGNVLQVFADAWQNTITGLGTARDKRSGAAIKTPSSSNDRQKYEDIYAGDDMGSRIADKPAEDMTRKWISLTVDTGDEGVSDDESSVADDIMQSLNELGAKGTLAEALTWAKVYGGSLVLMGADDGQEDLSQPLNEERIKSFDYLEVFDRFEVSVQQRYMDKEDGLDKLGKPKTYMIHALTGVDASLGEIHESRFLRFDGEPTARRRRDQNDGWNDSVYIKIEEVLADFNTSWGNTANLIQDFAQGIFKMSGLAEAIGAHESNIVLDRMRAMDLCRSSMRMIPIDESEEFERSKTPLDGLSDILELFMLRLSAAARMPVSILFGLSPSGLNNTAEGDLSVWYDHVESAQENILRPRLNRLIELLLKTKEGPTGGSEPDSWEYSFNPLWQMDEKEQAEARKIQAETDQIYVDINALEPEEVTFSRFGGESYSYETQIDKERRETEAKEVEQAEEEGAAGAGGAPVPVPAPAPAPTVAELEGEI